MKKSSTGPGPSASERISERIRELGDWRGKTLARIRKLILESVPGVEETWKWKGTPVWERDGILCTGETYKAVVKLTFAKGASLEDPAGLFNASLEGNMRRAIDLREGERIDPAAFKALLCEAVAHNGSRKAKGTSRAARPKLLSGGNPQIAKGDGEAPVAAYLAAVPGWKQAVGRRLDALVVRVVPGVRKAVKWNSPFYGIEGRGWFLSFHCFTKYLKVSFFKGSALRPLPPGESKSPEVRYLDLREDDPFDEEVLADWIRQASALPGWIP